MKKIVAVVLALVMVLGLATTAFAATTTSTVKAEGYSVIDMNNDPAVVLGDTFNKTVTDKTVTTTGDVTVTSYYADSYDFDVDGTADFYACDSTIAEAKLVKGGKVVAYLMSTDPGAMTKTVTKFVEANTVPACGEYAVDVFVVGTKVYEVGNAEYALFNGKAVGLGAELTPADMVPHVFTTKVTYNTKGEVATATCDNCKKSFTVVQTIPADYTGAVDSTSVAGIVLLGAYAPAATEGEKVESAETFDAGIAMYVGMSVMAAAGSAVVLKKKD